MIAYFEDILFYLLIELMHFILGYGICFGQIHRQRIDEFVILHEAEIQVRPGRESCLADVADDVALVDVLASPDAFGKGPHMAVGGRVRVVMMDFNITAIPALPAGERDSPIPDRPNRSARRSGIIHTQMRTIDF